MVGTTIQHYRIEERLGSGGMGEVYAAEDVRLGRKVAMKFLPPSLKADPESRARLLNEARAASALRSPNIAVTYDIGEDSGADFIVMEYVEGELLSTRLAQGPFPLRDAIEIGMQVADALDEAHGRGIVHRDIKSANLIRTERGLVKVLDFGLAKFIGPHPLLDGSTVTPSPRTMAGMVVGTISYMAPEQALGHPVDHRADLFSLGVVLFEMTVGRVPFAGGSFTEVIDRILHEIPPPPSRLNPHVPPAFDLIVGRALEKVPGMRYQTARAIHDDLRALADSLDAGGRPGASRIVPALATPAAAESAVAVMTFANITRESADDWIGTGIAETVSADLKNVHGLTVIARARVFDALRHLNHGSVMDEAAAIDIGRRLGATWMIGGGFQRVGETVRITATLLEVATGDLRRTARVDGRIADIFALQDKIVYELTQALDVALRGTEVADIERRETRSVDAYKAYARGMLNLRLATRDSLERAIVAFDEAARLDPEYALAWAALGAAYDLMGTFLSIDDLVLRAVDLERRALAIDPDLAEGHMFLGGALLTLGRFDEAIAAIEQALRLDPGNGQAHQGLARALWIGKGDFAAAIPEFERAIELNPEAGYSYLQLGLILSWEGQYDRALEVCRRAVELQQQAISGSAGLQIVGAHGRLGYVHYLRGDYPQAIAEYERGLALIVSSDHALRERTTIELNVKLGAAFHRAGRPAEAAQYFDRALRLFETLVGKGADDPFTRYYVSCVHALRGDAERALESLERVAGKLPALTAARVRRDPDLESLRDEPRFQRIAAAR